MGALDYVEADTVLHRMNALTKLFFACMLCIGSIVANTVLIQTLFFFLLLLIAKTGHVLPNVCKLVKALFGPCLFILILQIIFVRDGNRLFLFITDRGLISAYIVAMRVMNAAISMTMILMMTKMTDLANALVSKAGLSYRYAFIVTTAFRFIPILLDELHEIMEAQTARGVEFDTGNPLRKMQLVLPICAPLLINAIRRTDSSAVAAEIRGFYLRTKNSGYKDYPFAGRDFCCIIACLILVAVCVVGNIHCPL